MRKKGIRPRVNSTFRSQAEQNADFPVRSQQTMSRAARDLWSETPRHFNARSRAGCGYGWNGDRPSSVDTERTADGAHYAQTRFRLALRFERPCPFRSQPTTCRLSHGTGSDQGRSAALDQEPAHTSPGNKPSLVGPGSSLADQRRRCCRNQPYGVRRLDAVLDCLSSGLGGQGRHPSRHPTEWAGFLVSPELR